MIDAGKSKEVLLARKRLLLAEVAAIGQAPGDSPLGQRREVAMAEVRQINAEVKRLNVEEAIASKSVADRRRARGRAEQADNLSRAGASSVLPEIAPQPIVVWGEPQPLEQLPLEDILQRSLWQAARLRDTIRKISTRSAHSLATEFLGQLDAFIYQQAELCRGTVADPVVIDQGHQDEVIDAGGLKFPTDAAHETWRATWQDDRREDDEGAPSAAEPRTRTR